MAAFGILAALRERDRSGEGQLVDVSMADGALSLAGDGRRAVPRRRASSPHARRRPSSAAALVCYRPYACADGWVTLGALEPKFWQAWCRGVGREDLIEQQFERPGSRRARARSRRSSRAARATSGRRSPPSTTAAWSRCSTSTRRSTPSSCARARWSSSSTSPGAERPVRLLGVPVKLSRTPGDPDRGPGPGLGEHTDEVLRDAGYDDDADRGAEGESGAVAGPRDGGARARSWRERDRRPARR